MHMYSAPQSTALTIECGGSSGRTPAAETSTKTALMSVYSVYYVNPYNDLATVHVLEQMYNMAHAQSYIDAFTDDE